MEEEMKEEMAGINFYIEQFKKRLEEHPSVVSYDVTIRTNKGMTSFGGSKR